MHNGQGYRQPHGNAHDQQQRADKPGHAQEYVALDNVDDAVEQGYAGNQKEHARTDGNVGRRIEQQRYRSNQRRNESRYDKDDVMANVPFLHKALQGESDKRRHKDDCYRRPAAAEKLAERAIGTSHQECEQRVIDAGSIDNLLIPAFNLFEREMIVQRRPTERTQLGIEIKANRETLDRHDIAHDLPRLLVVYREDEGFMQQGHLRDNPKCLTDAHRIAHHTGGVYARAHQPDGITGDKIGYAMKLFFVLHMKFSENLMRGYAPKKRRKGKNFQRNKKEKNQCLF